MASETNEVREKSLNFLEEIIETSIARGDKRIQTRFPPEPNGYLHIGHAKSICINFGLAKKYGGKCNLRFDDTNPVKEDVEYVDSIKRDIQWLGFEWAQERYASDYFDQLYEWAIVLIKKGLAYVDDQTQEQIRETRGTVSEPGKESPWRNRTVEENLGLFERMRKGEFSDGEKVLRAKIDMAHPNMLFRDPIMYRIIHAEHHRTGDNGASIRCTTMPTAKATRSNRLPIRSARWNSTYTGRSTTGSSRRWKFSPRISTSLRG